MAVPPRSAQINQPMTHATRARLVNSAVWFIIILITLAFSSDYSLTILVFEVGGWIYLDRSLKNVSLQESKTKSLDEVLNEDD